MNNEQQATKQARETSDSLSPLVTQPSDGTPTQPKPTQQLDNVEREMSAFERSTIRLARLAVFISIVAAVFMCAQWWEMHTSGADTHDLAVAAGKQAEASKTLAEQAKAQTTKMSEALERTDRLITQATEQAKATNDLAIQARRSANTAQESLTFARQSVQLEQRPWIVPAIVQLSNEPDTDKKIGARVTIVNSGRTPALYITNQVTLLLWNTEPPFLKFTMPEHVPSRGILGASGEGNLSTAFFKVEDWQLNDVQIAAYKNKTAKIYLEAIVRYKGSSGAQYWTKICEFHISGTPLDEFSYCENGNDVGEGDVK